MSAPIDTERLRRALWSDCRRVAPDRWLAGDHVVLADGAYLLCDCMDFTIHGDRCKHCLCVLLHAGDPTVVAALRMLVAEPARQRKMRAA